LRGLASTKVSRQSTLTTTILGRLSQAAQRQICRRHTKKRSLLPVLIRARRVLPERVDRRERTDDNMVLCLQSCATACAPAAASTTEVEQNRAQKNK
jgi:hypothetical protein